jgi:hypothetical protein
VVTIAFNEWRIVDTTQLLGLAGAAIGGLLVGAVACHWYLGQVIALLRQRLERAVLLRNGELERADQARAQIAQLSAAIDELRRTRSVPGAQEPVAARPRQPSAQAEEPTLVLPQREPQAFADTQVMA